MLHIWSLVGCAYGHTFGARLVAIFTSARSFRTLFVAVEAVDRGAFERHRRVGARRVRYGRGA
ncbi:hypothetical protein GCM10027262_67400 [Nocardia tengchongensis]